jgi:hypothetical protein
MGTLTQCIRRAGKALDAQDAAEIRKLRNQLKAEGLTEAEAAKEAVAAHMNSTLDARDAILKGTPVAPSAMPDLPSYRDYEIGVSIEDDAGDRPFSVSRDKKTGALTVTGDIDAARELLPPDLRGRKTSSGLKFSGSAAARANNALTGKDSVYSRGGEVTKHPVKDGKYVGAPDKFNTPAKISGLRKSLRRLADEGGPGRLWYENSSKAVLDYVGGDTQEARKFVALLSIYSPQAKVDANTTFALRAWAQYKAGQPIRVKTRSQDGKATKAMQDVDKFWSGEKTGNFFNNLLVEIDPSTRGHQGATIDLWMMRAGQYANDAPNRSQYAFMEVETNRLAQELGWEPHQVQAAIWVALKARMENKGVKQRTEARSEKRGWIRFDTDKKGKKVRVILDAQKHRDNWLREALDLDVQPSDTAVAKFDYSDGIRRHVGTFGAEGAAQEALEALTDDAGTDILALKLGILAGSGDVVVAPDAGQSGLKAADPAQVESLNIYADTLRQVSGASTAHWWRPFYKSRKMDQNAVLVSMDRAATDEELAAAETAVGAYMQEAGVENWRQSFAIIRDRNGMLLMNQGAVPNSELKTIFGLLDFDTSFDGEQLAVDGSIITGDTDGQGNLAGLGSERQRDILAWARGFLEEQGIQEAVAGVEEEAGTEEVGVSRVYENLETRAGTSEQQRATGRSALRDLERRLNALVERRRPGGVDGGRASVLGQRLLANFKAGEPGQLVGAKIESSEDLAALAQVYRNPKFETLRFIYLKGDEVVGENAHSSRMPGAVRFSAANNPLGFVKADMERLGATGYMMLHNHPSGSAVPSDGDRRFTGLIAREIDGFRGHVIVDFNEYSALDERGRGEPIARDFQAEDFTATPEAPHPILGRTVTSPLDLADLAKIAKPDDGSHVVILTNTRSEVNQVTSLPNDFFQLIDNSSGKSRAAAILRSMAREGGSVAAYLVPGSTSLKEGQAIARHGSVFRDVLINGRSAPFRGGQTITRLMLPGARMVSDRLAGMPETVEVDGRQVKFEDFEPAKQAARKYMEKAGLDYQELTTYAELDKDRARRIAREFERMEHAPGDPEVKASYDAMIDETLEQFQAVLDTGLQIRFIKGEDPYGNPRNAVLDVVENNHLFVFSTKDGFGSDDTFDASENPLLRETDFKTADGDPMLANDVFRVVHDYFGHIKNGVGFRARGEENAWQSHAAMYSPLARRAMTTETRGQNNWVNFGPNAEFNQTASGADTVYADQKIGLMPIWVSEEGRLSAGRRADRDYQEGLEGAVVDGRLQLSHFSSSQIERTDSAQAGTGLDRGQRNRYLPRATYFGITRADENGYRREPGLGRIESEFSIAVEAIYPVNKDPEGLRVRGNYPQTIENIKAAGYSGFWSNDRSLGKVAVIWDPLDAGVDEDVAPYSVNDGGLYSALERAIADARIPGLTPSKRNPAGAIRAESWLQYLRNRSIKQEEWKWTGMRDLLNADPRRRFTRDELLAEVRERRVQLGDIVSGSKGAPTTAPLPGIQEEEPSENIRPTGQGAETWGEILADGALNWRRTITENINSLGLDVWNVPGSDVAIVGSREDEAYILSEWDGRSYNPLDGYDPAYSFNEARVQLASAVGSFSEDDASSSPSRWEEYIDRGEYGDYHELKVTAPDVPGDFSSSIHFSEPNILGFVRATMRDDGKRYHIEELQSDWHQLGREKGYADRLSTIAIEERVKKARLDFNKASDQLKKQAVDSFVSRHAELGLTRFDTGMIISNIDLWLERPKVGTSPTLGYEHELTESWVKAQFVNDVIGLRPDGAPPVETASQALSEASSSLLPYFEAQQKALSEKLQAEGEQHRSSLLPPDAPFKNDVWISLMAKRAVIEAARRGADTISWTTAENQMRTWSKDYEELYRNTYDKKLPAIMRRLTGGEFSQLPASGGAVKFSMKTGRSSTDSPMKDNRWEGPLTEEVKARVLTEGLPMFRATEQAGGMSAAQVREAVSELPEEMRDRMFIAESAEQLPQHVRDEMRRQGASSISGYFDRQTQRVWLVASAIRSKRDAQVTLLHESVGHRGIEAVMGPQIGEFLSMVNGAQGSDKVIDDAYEYVRRMYPGAPPVVHASEVVARIAEADPKHSLVQRVIQWFRQSLRRMGFDVAFTNGDIVEALRRARRAAPGQEADAGGLFRQDDGFDTSTTYYHGARPDSPISEPAGGMYFTPDPGYAEGFTEGLFGAEGRGAMYPVHLKMERPKIIQAAPGSDLWERAVSREFDDLGPEYDSWILKDESGAIDQVFVKDAETQVRSAFSQGDALFRQDSDEDRKARARAMGFDTSQVMYHGSPNKFDSFQLGRVGAVFLTPRKEYAQMFGEEREFYIRPGVQLDMVNNMQHRNLVIEMFEDEGGWERMIEEGAGPEDGRTKYDPSQDMDWEILDTMMDRLPSIGFDSVRFYEDNVAKVEAVAVFDPSDIRSVDAAFEEEGSNIMFRAEESNPTGFSVPDERLRDAVIRKWQDKFKQLKRVQETIQESGGTVDASNDAYRAEELFHGKTGEDLRIAREQFIEPLAKKMAEYNITHAELDDYLYAVHAPERNAHIAEINEAMPDGGSGMTNMEAGQILVRAKKAGKLEQLQELETFVRGMVDAQREIILSGGLEDDGTVAAWQAKYNHYVPLKGFAEDTKEMGKPDIGPRTGQGFMIRGNESRRALGRRSRSASPLSYTIMDLTEKLIRARKNEVGNTLLKLIEDNPNPDYWQVFTDDDPDMTPSLVRRRNPNTGEMEERVENSRIDMRRSEDYFMTKRDGTAYFMKLKDPLLMRAMKNLGPEQINSVLRGMAGVNRFLSAMNTSYAPEFIISNFVRDFQTAALNLSAERSLGSKGKAVADKKIRAELRNTLRSIPVIAMAQKSDYQPKGKKAQEIKRWYEEYRAAGAQTGYFDRKDIDGVAKDLDTIVRMARGGTAGNALKFGKAVKDSVEFMNTGVENGVRLAAYISARKAGLSESDAASLAKNMTVNFNRRGEIGTTLNALYMFANASIQGTANFARTMLTFKPEGRGLGRLNNAQRIGVGLVAGAYAIAALNREFGGEDDDGERWYDKVPDYDRERNLIFMKSLFDPDAEPGTYYKIPLPYGYNVFAVLGDNIEGVTSGGRDAMQSATRTVLAILGSFSPIGFQSSESVAGIIGKNLTPSPFTPVAELMMNENFAGSTIYTENLPFGSPLPDSSLGRRSTGEAYKNLAMWLNEVSGGSEQRTGKIDINPDIMEHVVDHFTGSAGSFVSRVVDTGAKLKEGIVPETSQTVFLRRLDGKVRPYDDQNTFYQRRDEIRQVEAELKVSRGEEREQFREEFGGLIKLRGPLKRAENKMKLWRQRRDRVYENEALTAKEKDEQLKAIEAEMETIVDEFNRIYVESAR